MNSNKERIEKLPKWVKDILNRQNRVIKELQADVAKERDMKINPTNVSFREYGGELGISRYLDDRIHYDFRLGEHRDNFIGVKIENGVLHLAGGHGLTISPSSSNTCDIKVRDVKVR